MHDSHGDDSRVAGPALGGPWLKDASVGEQLFVRRASAADAPLIEACLSLPDFQASVFLSGRGDLARVLDRADRALYLAYDGCDEPLGWVRFDLRVRTRDAVVVAAVHAGRRGRGIGRRMIASAASQLFAAIDVDLMHAYVGAGNAASLKAFAAAGFVTRACRQAPMPPSARASIVHLVLKRK